VASPEARGRPAKLRGCIFGRPAMDKDQVLSHVLRLLDDVLSLNGRAQTFTRDTDLLGALPELEEQLGLVVDDDDIDGDTFATVGSLADFVAARLG
jgi:acyl carrier protein